MFTNSKLAKSIRLAMAFGAASTALVSNAVLAQQADEDGVEKIEVTGSRIKRVDMEGPSPVQVFDKGYLEATGAQTVQDFLFQSSFAGPGLTSENATLSQGAGAATFDARGFGSAYTVILINGRRMPGSPTGGSAAADLNQIPLAAVDRIEFLASGASAIYGADAISGVINIITKKDFNGLSVKAQYGQSFDSDGQRSSFEVVAGTASEKSSTLFSFDYFKQRPVNASDRELSASATSPVTGEDGRSPTGFPGTWLAPDFSKSVHFSDCPTESIRPATIAKSGTECAYDFAPLYQSIPFSERFNAFVTHHQELTDDLSGFVEARYSRAFTEVRNGAAPGVFPGIAGDYPGNPFGDGSWVIRRSVDAGPRSRDGVNSTFNIATGLDYTINDEMTVSGYYSKSWANNNQAGRGGNISKKRLSDAVAKGFIVLGGANPALAIQAPIDKEGKVWVAIPTHRQGELTEEVVNISLDGQFDVLEGLGFAVGYENRQEEYFDYTDIAQIEGDVAGGAASFGSGGREFDSVFFETSLFPLEGLEFQLALRYDDISTSISDLGSKTTHKVAVSYRPTDNLLLRASAGSGFKAPALGQLFLGSSFGVSRVIDTAACAADKAQCNTREARVKSGGNPQLAPEEADNLNIGFSWEIIDGLDVTADYWSIEVEGKIGSLGAQEILNNEASYGDLINRVGGNLYHPDAFIVTTLQNLSKQEGSGVDLDLSYGFEVGGGNATLGANFGHLLSMKRQSSAIQPLCEDAGTTSEPEWRTNLRASWENDDYGVNVSVRYVGETEDNPAGRADQSCASQNADRIEQVDSYTQIDMQGYYILESGTKLTLGIRNIADKQPPYSSVAAGGWPWYDQALYDNMGRFMYASVEYKF